MSTSKENLEKLFKTLNDTIFSIRLEYDKLEKELVLKDSLIEELEENQSLKESKLIDSEIDCGIGKIEYREPDNLALKDVMENLESAITKTNFSKVREVLAGV